MKRVLIVFLLFVLLIGCFGGCTQGRRESYLRIHIRANSNSTLDQQVKMKIKDEIVTYLSSKLQNCNSKEDAIILINQEIENIELLANSVLSLNGMEYSSKAIIKKENFPTRSYGDLTLEAGSYDALIINLGTGEGDNWWCIVFPPLCFVSEKKEKNVTSLIYEIYKRFKSFS